MALGEVGGVGGELVGDDAFLTSSLVGQAEVFLGRDVAEHGGAVPADHRGTDAAGDMVVARRCRWSRGRGYRTGLRRTIELQIHVLLDHVHGHMAGTFDHHLNIVLPGDLGPVRPAFSTHRVGPHHSRQIRSRTQTITEGEGDIVGLHDFADILEVRVEEAFPCDAPSTTWP